MLFVRSNWLDKTAGSAIIGDKFTPLFAFCTKGALMRTKRRKAKRRAKKLKLTPFERLKSARLLDPDDFNEEEKAVVNKFSGREVRELIEMRRKYGAAPRGKGDIRPNMPL
jgi:hypothetical protein